MKRKLDLDPLALRRDAYPAGGDQLDAIWKMIGVLIADAPAKTRAKLDPAAVEMLGQVQKVKARFPRPEDAGSPKKEK